MGFKSLFIKPSKGEAPEPDIDVDAMLSQLKSTSKAVTAAGTPEPSVTPSTGIVENRPLGEIYASAGISDSGMTINRVIDVMKGLASLPPDAQKVAIRAMDSADDSWSIEDVHRDAKQRLAALEGEKARIRTSLQAEKDSAATELAELDQATGEVKADIEAQIASLQEQLAKQLGEAAARRQQTEERIRTTEATAQREVDRLERERSRLTQAVGSIPAATSDNTKNEA